MPTNFQSRFSLRDFPVTAYFLLTFVLSWTAALAVAAPHLLRHEPLPKLTGILMFPAMLVGPLSIGILMRWVVDGRHGLSILRSQLLLVAVPLRWYAVMLIPPVLVLLVLLALKTWLSPAYTPNHFWLGLTFGIPAGLLEEIGWTGFAFRKMQEHFSAFSAAVLVGLVWSSWHLPVIDFLGAASPHGPYLLPFFFAFALAMTAMRVLIAWLYTNTHSILLSQLLHISSTGSLVVFGAFGLKPKQEVLWYALYGLALWCVVGGLVGFCGRQLKYKQTGRQ